jgi:hypothetical protein
VKKTQIYPGFFRQHHGMNKKHGVQQSRYACQYDQLGFAPVGSSRNTGQTDTQQAAADEVENGGTCADRYVIHKFIANPIPDVHYSR